MYKVNLISRVDLFAQSVQHNRQASFCRSCTQVKRIFNTHSWWWRRTTNDDDEHTQHSQIHTRTLTISSKIGFLFPSVLRVFLWFDDRWWHSEKKKVTREVPLINHLQSGNIFRFCRMHWQHCCALLAHVDVVGGSLSGRDASSKGKFYNRFSSPADWVFISCQLQRTILAS